jgi:hypothetical protein
MSYINGGHISSEGKRQKAKGKREAETTLNKKCFGPNFFLLPFSFCLFPPAFAIR